MMHWNLGWGAMMIGGLGMLALWTLLVLLVLWGIRMFVELVVAQRSRPPDSRKPP